MTAWAQCAAALDALQKTNPAARAVVSMSYGSAGGSDGLPGLGGSASLGGTRTYVTRLYARKDMLFLAAAGNDGDSRTAFPAGYPEVVSVAATGPSGAYAKFSNYNSDVELAAPGSDTLSTLALRDSYGRVGGASLRVSSPLRAPASLIQPPATEFMGSSTGAERQGGGAPSQPPASPTTRPGAPLCPDAGMAAQLSRGHQSSLPTAPTCRPGDGAAGGLRPGPLRVHRRRRQGLPHRAWHQLLLRKGAQLRGRRRPRGRDLQQSRHRALRGGADQRRPQRVILDHLPLHHLPAHRRADAQPGQGAAGADGGGHRGARGAGGGPAQLPPSLPAGGRSRRLSQRWAGLGQTTPLPPPSPPPPCAHR